MAKESGTQPWSADYDSRSSAVRHPAMAFLERELGCGWEVREGNRGLLVPTKGGGWIGCVDGRPINGPNWFNTKTRGPKIQGAAEGVALLLAQQRGLARVDSTVFDDACRYIKTSGYVPALHDMQVNPVGCGHAKLGYQSYFTQYPELALSSEEMVRIVKQYGGGNINLQGHHAETTVRINYTTNTTLEPNWEAFNLDAWYAAYVGISETEMLLNAVQTVLGLNSPARIVEVF